MCVCVCVGEWGGMVRLKLEVQFQGSGKILNADGQRAGGEGSSKLDNFYGCHMCIVP